MNIPAHHHPLSAIAFSHNADMVATASNKVSFLNRLRIMQYDAIVALFTTNILLLFIVTLFICNEWLFVCFIGANIVDNILPQW